MAHRPADYVTYVNHIQQFITIHASCSYLDAMDINEECYSLLCHLPSFPFAWIYSASIFSTCLS